MAQSMSSAWTEKADSRSTATDREKELRDELVDGI